MFCFLLLKHLLIIFASCGLNRQTVLYECLDHFERLCHSQYYIVFYLFLTITIDIFCVFIILCTEQRP